MYIRRLEKLCTVDYLPRYLEQLSGKVVSARTTHLGRIIIFESAAETTPTLLYSTKAQHTAPAHSRREI